MDTVIAAILIFLAAFSRLLPHPPNFAPVAATALLSGAVLPRRWSLLVPLGAMLLSDALIGFYQPAVMVTVYGSFLLVVLLGWFVRRAGRRPTSIFFAALGGSVIFFLTTNFAVWAWGGLYPATSWGLFSAYVMGVPFFRNTLAGDLFYSGALFGIYGLAVWFGRNRSWFRDRQFLRGPYRF